MGMTEHVAELLFVSCENSYNYATLACCITSTTQRGLRTHATPQLYKEQNAALGKWVPQQDGQEDAQQERVAEVPKVTTEEGHLSGHACPHLMPQGCHEHNSAPRASQ